MTRNKPFFVDSPESARAMQYLIGSAQSSIDDGGVGGRECASAFAAMMVNGGLDVGPQESDRADLTDLELAARRELSLWDLHAIAAIGAAYDMAAMQDHDLDAAKKIVTLGSVLLTRWPGYARIVRGEDAQ